MLNALLKEPLFTASMPGKHLRAKPLGFIDVGARGDIHSVVEALAEVTAVLAFEPDEKECARLKAQKHSLWARYEVEPVALAENRGESVLHIFTTPANNSLRPAHQAMVKRYHIKTLEQIGTLSFPTVSLDEVVFDTYHQNDYWGEFIKLDTQGTEFEILQGARRTLSERTVALFTEVEFFQIYEGQKLFSEIELFLRNLGFSFYGFAGLHHRSCRQLDKHHELGKERVIWADAVFFKDPLPGAYQSTSLSERGHHTLFVCAMLLGYYDFALELALKTWAVGDEATRISNLVHHYANHPPTLAYQEAMALAEQVRTHPASANVKVGRFVDQRRYQCDYDDMVGE